MQIQKLKEKAMMIQMSRDVNKPNRYASPNSNNQSLIYKKQGKDLATPPNEEIFPTRGQVEYARSVARRK